MSFVAKSDFVYRLNPVLDIREAAGAVLTDAEGYRYLDMESANGSVSLGYDNTLLAEGVEKVKDIISLPCFCESPIRSRLTERLGTLLESATGQKGKIAYELGGAQAMELAMKVVRSNTRASQYVVFEGGYHGRSGFASQFSASHRYRTIVGDWRLPVVRLPYPDCDQCRFGRTPDTCNTECVHFVKQLATQEFGGAYSQKSGADVAAFIFEPVLNAGGMALPDKRYLEETAAFYQSKGALLVVDEVFTGFYRTGKPFGFMHYNITPDIIVFSKALTNGIVPLSVVWAKDPLMLESQFPPASHSLTFGNNALALGVADAVLDRYEKWTGVEQHVQALSTKLNEVVQQTVKAFPGLIKSGYVIGAAGRFLLRDNFGGRITELARTIAREEPVDGFHGFLLANSGLAPGVVVFKPPLNIAMPLIDVFGELLQRTFTAYQHDMHNN